MADPISYCDEGQGFGILEADPKSVNSDYKKDCVYTVTRLSNGLVYLYGRSDRLYVNKPNTLLLTEKQTGRGRDIKVNKKD